MKFSVCYVSPEFSLTSGGAISSQTYEIAKRLLQMGHEVHMLISEEKCDGTPDGINCHNLRTNFRYSKNLLELPFNSLELIQKTKETISELRRQFRIDTVHCVYPFSAVGVASSSELSKLSTLFVEYNPSPWIPEYKLHFPWYQSTMYKFRSVAGHYLDLNMRKLILKKFRCVVTVSNFIKEKIIEKDSISSAKIRTVYCGVDTHKFSPDIDSKWVRTKFKIFESPLVVYIGRFSPRKGLEYLIKAAPIILKEHPDTKFMIVGPESLYFDRVGVDKYSRYLRLLIQKLGLDKSFILTGYEANPAPFLATSNVFAFPSFYEGCPLVVEEAMSCGVPTVAFDVSSLPELINNQIDGLLVPERNGVNFAEAVNTLLGDVKLAKKLGANARKTAVKRFSWEVIIKELLNVYASTLNTNGDALQGCSPRIKRS